MKTLKNILLVITTIVGTVIAIIEGALALIGVKHIADIVTIWNNNNLPDNYESACKCGFAYEKFCNEFRFEEEKEES